MSLPRWLAWLAPTPDPRVLDLEARLASVEAQTETRVREAFAMGALRAEDQADLAQGYRRLSDAQGKNPWRRDLQPLAQDQMQRLVYWLWESNPLAKWLIETPVNFMLGEGASVISQNDQVRAVIEAFWGDPVNQLDRRLRTWARELLLYGELCLPVSVNAIDGHVRLGYVDPLAIDEVVTDPDNALITTAVRIKSSVTGGPKQLLKVIREDTRRASSTHGLLMPNAMLERDLATGEPYAGACFLFQINRVSSARRGRSELLPDIDWLDGFDAFLFDSMDAASQFNTFLYDVTLEGMSEDQIRAWLANNTRMKRGMIRAHNEKVKWAEVTPDLKAQDKDAYAKLLLSFILGGHSIPLHWYASGEGVSFASAKEMGLVPVKAFTSLQQEVRRLIADLVRFAIHQAIRVGALPETVVVGQVDAAGSSTAITAPTDCAFTVVLPELSMRDQAAIVAAINGLTAATQQVVALGWMRPETAARVLANMYSQLGMDIKPEEEYTPGAGPQGAALQDYPQQDLQRLMAQLQRVGRGDGENLGQPKDDQTARRASVAAGGSA